MFISVKNLKKFYGEEPNRFQVLQGLSFDINKGEFVVILGPSGSGKSTLLNILGGIDNFEDGSISINGELMENLNENKLTTYRRKHLGYVFQSYNLIPILTIKENIETGAFLSNDPLDVNEVISSLGLKGQENKFPRQLSGGQQQRVSIGRAIIKNPDLLLADEPTGALDYKTSKEILEVFENVNQKYHSTIVMVTHNEAIKLMADRVIVMKDGQILSNYINEKKVKAKDLEW